jgi:hypothetical protein
MASHPQSTNEDYIESDSSSESEEELEDELEQKVIIDKSGQSFMVIYNPKSGVVMKKIPIKNSSR